MPGGKRIPTPPPPEDEPRYLTVVHPYPLNANLELHADRRTLALWLACCTGKDVLFAMFHKPASPGMVVIEVDRDFDSFDRLLGLHTWSKFLQKPSEEQRDKVSKVFYCTYNTGRLVEKHGWKRVNIEEHWFNGWTANNAIIRHPYPNTSYCDVPSEAKTGAPMCRPLPQKSFPVPPPPPEHPVGSAEWLAARNANPSASPPRARMAAPRDTASVTCASPRGARSFSSPPSAPSPARRPPYDPDGPVELSREYEYTEEDRPTHSTVAVMSDIFDGNHSSAPPSVRRGRGRTRPPGIDDPDYDPWNAPAEAAGSAIEQPEAVYPAAPCARYDAPRLELPTKVQKKDEWACPQHGPLCNPGICKERAQVELDERMRIFCETELQIIERVARRAKKKDRGEGREKEAEAMALGGRHGPPHFRGNSNSNKSGTSDDALRDEGNLLAQTQAVQANVLEDSEAVLDVRLPPGGPGSSWGDPNEPR